MSWQSNCTPSLVGKTTLQKPLLDFIDRFYQETENYIYTLAIWEASGNRPEYVNHALPYLQKYCACRILDFGCGIGTDGLKLLAQGYHVTFYDFRSLSLEFLVWRLQQRNWSAEVVFAGEEKEVPGFDSLWLMDVIEHLPNPLSAF